MRTAAFYQVSDWTRPRGGILDMLPHILIPLTFTCVPYEEAEVIFIDYGGNADHIPLFESVIERYPHKKIVLFAGENLRRSQATIPKKISTKASHKDWARKIFPYTYLPAHALFPLPQSQEDLRLYALLKNHKDNPNIISLLCEDTTELGIQSFHYPLFLRRVIAKTIPLEILNIQNFSEQLAYDTIHKSLSSLHTHTQGDDKRDVFCSTVFSNTSKERVIAYNTISKLYKVAIYGKNPFYRGERLDAADSLFRNSQYVICFENSALKGYCTEKLYAVIFQNAIPIYWGDPDIERYCNEKSMILCKTTKDIKQLGKTIDKTERNVKQYYNTPYFLPQHINNIFADYMHARNHMLQLLTS